MTCVVRTALSVSASFRRSAPGLLDPNLHDPTDAQVVSLTWLAISPAARHHGQDNGRKP
jgi:hypothetical protein